MLWSVRTLRARFAPVIVSLGTLLVSRASLADDPCRERPVRFSLAASESPLDACGGADALARWVDERLRRSVFTHDGTSDVTIAIAPEPEASDSAEWRARIVATDRAGVELGRREVPLPSADCAKAIETLAVVLAIMIGPPRTTTEPLPGPAPAEGPVPPSTAPAPAPAQPPAPRRERASDAAPSSRPTVAARWTASPLVEIAGGTGILPGVAWGIGAGAIVRPPVDRVSFLPRMAYWPPHATGTQPPADVDRVGGALLGCYDLLRGPNLTLAGCGGVDVGRVQARSEDLTQTAKSSLILGALGEIRLGHRIELGPGVTLEPGIAGQASSVLRRDRFTYRGLAGQELTLLLPAPVAWQTSVGAAVHFW